MPIKVEIVADSINVCGNRLTTFVLEFPRFILPEFATHRMFSKNAASSRAIPIEKMIQQVIDNPAMPVWWGKNQSGMQAAEELDNETSWNRYAYGFDKCLTNLELAKEIWLESRDKAIEQVKRFNELGLHKQITNRLLEPWFHIRVICSATEYENFFALRVHPDAQPEIRVLAERMLEEYNKSEPKKLANGEWNIPFGDKIDRNRVIEFLEKSHGFAENSDIEKCFKKIAVARCARVSYFNYEGKDDYEADIKLCDRLFGSVPRHLSPTEHVAQAMGSSDFVGNFRGFKQYRKFFEDENLKDNRVKRHF
jgi:thymidylate synthase ThyX